MSNHPHIYHPLIEDRKNPQLPSLFDISLRELLEKHAQEPALLHQILVCKAEEDKVKAEELRYKTELVKLEIRRLENDAMKDYKLSPKLPPSVSQIKPPLPSVQSINHGGGVTSLKQYSLINYADATSNGNSSKPPPPPPQVLPSNDNEQIYIPRRENAENHQSASTIQLRSIPAPYYNKRNVSRGEVLEALRNKVLSNNRNRTGSGGNSRYKNTLPPMQEHHPRSSPEAPYRNGHPDDHPSGSQHESQTTLSNLQPRDYPQSNNVVGPFSAPAGGPHLGFRFPPPNTESQTFESKENH